MRSHRLPAQHLALAVKCAYICLDDIGLTRFGSLVESDARDLIVTRAFLSRFHVHV
jgi:hypothetical protein